MRNRAARRPRLLLKRPRRAGRTKRRFRRIRLILVRTAATLRILGSRQILLSIGFGPPSDERDEVPLGKVLLLKRTSAGLSEYPRLETTAMFASDQLVDRFRLAQHLRPALGGIEVCVACWRPLNHELVYAAAVQVCV